jgi:four helix bundle suffix protein
MRPSGGYRELRTFQTATILYDATYWFCEKFLDPRSRTVDQMVQAARSGRQNIAEGSRASATSSQTELRLVNVARASLEELLLDYEDFLRHRRLRQWAQNDPEALAVRRVGQRAACVDPSDRSDQSDRSDPSDLPYPTGVSDPPAVADLQRYACYARWLDHADPAMRANAAICLLHQTNYLLDQQIAALEEQFVEGGGYSEQLATARLARRAEKAARPRDPSDQSDPSDRSDPIPPCPKCGKPMALRTAQKGQRAGKQFWGCTGYPDCKGLVDL